jgi:putative transposase
LRFRLTLWDLSKMFVLCGIVFSPAAVRDWEAKLAQVPPSRLRQQRRGKGGTGRRSWHVDENYPKVRGRWCYLYRANDLGLDPQNWSGGRASFSGTVSPRGGGGAMKQKRYTDEQIAFALRQAESGTAVTEICRKLGISEPTFYRWKKQFAGIGTAEIRRLKQLEEENAKLKRLVADLSLDKTMLQDVLRRKW